MTGAAQTALLMVAARAAACVWGDDYWLLGNLSASLRAVSIAF